MEHLAQHAPPRVERLALALPPAQPHKEVAAGVHAPQLAARSRRSIHSPSRICISCKCSPSLPILPVTQPARRVIPPPHTHTYLRCSSSMSRVLPMPGSPSTSTTPPRCSRTSCTQRWEMAESSPSRPARTQAALAQGRGKEHQPETQQVTVLYSAPRTRPANRLSTTPPIHRPTHQSWVFWARPASGPQQWRPW